MDRRRLATAAGALGLTVASVVGLWVRPAAAVSGLTVGSWWSGQAADGTVPPPPTFPAGGLWIGYAPSGPTAISATPVVTLTSTARSFGARIAGGR